jgi:hypothetical protein
MMRTAKKMGQKQREDAKSHEEEKQNARTRERNTETTNWRETPAHRASGSNRKGTNAKDDKTMAGPGNDPVQVYRTGRANHWEFFASSGRF